MIARRFLFSIITVLSVCTPAVGQELHDTVRCDSVAIEVPIKADIANLMLDSIMEIRVNQRYLERVERLHQRWATLIPNKFQMQYAGNVGLISMGLGWDYGKRNQWETYVLVGYIPKCRTINEVWTFTLKELYTPWRVNVTQNISVEPLFATLFINSIFNSEFWNSEPDRYPKGYYGFSSKMRFHVGVGQSATLRIPTQYQKRMDAVTVFYEVSSCELYLRQKFISRTIPWKDIICLGAGLRLRFF